MFRHPERSSRIAANAGGNLFIPGKTKELARLSDKI
jgi:hypothetical protein